MAAMHLIGKEIHVCSVPGRLSFIWLMSTLYVEVNLWATIEDRCFSSPCSLHSYNPRHWSRSVHKRLPQCMADICIYQSQDHTHSQDGYRHHILCKTKMME